MDNISLSMVSKSQKFVYFLEVLEAVEDPRVNRRKKHALSSILVITVFGYLCGANTVVGIVNFAKRRFTELAELIDLSNGIPSRSTFMRALGMIKWQDLEFWLNYWLSDELHEGKDRHVAIDGKTDRANNSCCVRAFEVNTGKVEKHTNVRKGSCELAATPELLDNLALKNTVVTADALHTQVKNVRKIVSKGGNYVFVVKRNQGQLYEDLEFYFSNLEEDPFLRGTYEKVSETEISRNRFERRVCISTSNVAWLEQRNRWSKLKSISMIRSSRSVNGTTSTETRFIISSLAPDPKRILGFARRHWEIENRCHRFLDFTFDSDRCTVRNRNAAQCISVLKDFALAILLNSRSTKSLSEQRLDNLVRFDQLAETLFLRSFK